MANTANRNYPIIAEFEDPFIDTANAQINAIDADVQGVDEKIDNLTAADIPYDNTTSGLTATEVQAAIDEVAAGGGGGITSGKLKRVDTGAEETMQTGVEYYAPFPYDVFGTKARAQYFEFDGTAVGAGIVLVAPATATVVAGLGFFGYGYNVAISYSLPGTSTSAATGGTLTRTVANGLYLSLGSFFQEDDTYTKVVAIYLIA